MLFKMGIIFNKMYMTLCKYCAIACNQEMSLFLGNYLIFCSKNGQFCSKNGLGMDIAIDIRSLFIAEHQ